MNFNQCVGKDFSDEYVKTLKHKQRYTQLIEYLISYADNSTTAMNELALCFYYGRGVEKNWDKVFEYNQRAADLGDIDGLAYLGFNYLYGVGVAVNYVEAIRLLRITTQKNNHLGQRYLGYCYEEGLGVDIDKKKAYELYRLSADQDDATAKRFLGQCYEYGIGVDKNESEAVKWYRKSAEQENAVAEWILGQCYEYGIGVDKNESEAVKWYRKSAEHGDAEAQKFLGISYENGIGVEKDEEEAVEWYRKSAEQENAVAERLLGQCYEYGIGVDKNESEAVKWYRKSAEQENAVAEWILGQCYEYGIGVGKNENEAIKWYRKSAEHGDAEAQRFLGKCYKYGIGVEKDEEEAVEWYIKSAEQGNLSSQLTLGNYYFSKSEKEQDINYCKALHYFNLIINSSESEVSILANTYRLLGDMYRSNEREKESHEMYRLSFEYYEEMLAEDDNNAFYWLGEYYEKGWGVKRNYQKAISFYTSAGSIAYRKLGYLYERGYGDDKRKAIELYKSAIDQGDIIALSWLGRCYEYGNGVKKNLNEAISLYIQSAKEGWPIAYVYLGMCYYHGIGVEKDEKKAYEMFLQISDIAPAMYYIRIIENSDDYDAMYVLGFVFSFNYSFFSRDLEKSFYFYSLAAKGGHKQAQYKLATYYQKGMGIRKNYMAAFLLFKELHKKGNIEATFSLGRYYYYGICVKKNFTTAIDYFKKASDAGHAAATFYMGLCFEYGRGTKKDLNKAVIWYKKAIDVNADYAKTYLGLHYLIGYVGILEKNRKHGLDLILKDDNTLSNYIYHAVKNCNNKKFYRDSLQLIIIMCKVQFYNCCPITDLFQMGIKFFHLFLKCRNTRKDLMLEINDLRHELLDFKKMMNKGDEESLKNINKKYDFFISHASEDKLAIAEPLAKALIQKGANVWYDNLTLKIGDSLRESIDIGLANSKYGIVILSETYFRKFWTSKELNGLFIKQEDGEKVILPVWHGISKDIIKQYSPMLADMVAFKSSDYSIEELADELIQIIK